MKKVHGVKHGPTDADRLSKAFGLASSRPAAKKVPPIGGGKGPAPTGAKPRSKKKPTADPLDQMDTGALDQLLNG